MQTCSDKVFIHSGIFKVMWYAQFSLQKHFDALPRYSIELLKCWSCLHSPLAPSICSDLKLNPRCFACVKEC